MLTSDSDTINFMIENVPWRDFVTFGVAVLGAGLGILNTWNAISQRAVRLRVKPAYAITHPGKNFWFSIEVVNLSTFPVTINEIGFLSSGGRRIIIGNPVTSNGRVLPWILEPRTAVSGYFDPATLPRSKNEPIGDAYALTACGERRRGSSPALKQLRQIAAEVSTH